METTEAVQPTENGGLLDSVTTEDSQGTEQQNPESTQISHLAEQEDDTPLDRPDWWPENFWKKDDSAPDLEGIAKSWMDLRKQISQGKHNMSWAQENGISQLALDSLVGKVVGMGAEKVESVTRSLAEEKASLGPNADVIIKGMTDWARGLVNKGVWGKDDFEEFKYMGGTAKGLKALMKLRETYEGSRIPVESVPIEGAPSKDELYQMVGDPKYKTDPSYRAKVEKMFAQNFG